MNIEFGGDVVACRLIHKPRYYKPNDIVIHDGQFKRVTTVQSSPNIVNVNYTFSIMVLESATGAEVSVRNFDGMVWRPTRWYKR